MNLYQKALNLFFSQFPNLKSYKYKIKKIKQGFTNSTFLIYINLQKYQIRIAQNNNIVNRKNEYNVLQNINDNNYLYYDLSTGNSIKKWIKGNNLVSKKITRKIIFKLNDEITKLHETEIKEQVVKFDPFIFYNETKNKIDNVYNLKYLDLISQIDYSKLVLSHNDISLVNTIYDKNNVYLIDFEWAKLNHKLWDYANFIREADLSIKLIKYWTKINTELNFNDLLIFLFLTTCYALQWTYVTTQNNKIIKYRKKTLKKLKKYYQFLGLTQNE